MKKVCLVLLIVSFILACNKDEKGKILIVVSNTEDMGDPEKHFAGNNLWEVAPPYHIFVSHGYEVDFVSPTGEKVPFSMDPMGISSYAIKYEDFNGKVEASLTPDQVDYKNYKAVFIGGGYGPLFDVADNEDMLEIIAKIYEAGGIVGGCGHGPGAFANVKLSNGEYMVKDKKVTGFPNSTEVTKSWAKQGTLLPIMLEDQLRANGAMFQNKSDLNDKHDVVVDERIVTTMFLPSSAIVAKEMILEMEKTHN
ncbi:MAG: type 1 glutamine amidotransferase domain-containing protein [Muricauda sp.]|nr:type 1 glutamine amidotransferase domain-containing protein [Allomuricauda sp.]MBO6588675.1 type 1 glutamine amidotransferase domain-containing protein [Allomuricauda sp.]MBO6618186.1 type 1 glutamine amidotransferase domain-containing protein [Allomuricauda sp.]MBO6644213.1 type 1 glutamine amidotransferase domain-containing protein [Allomuricauda sp.]MBO6747790.1 type 1 glutamine amidotransferase domain-containing protein [Allomuricauda sp.]MBO6844483.1 type 1 glutamine amidotransferase d